MKNLQRNGDGRLMAHTDIGGYPLFYIDGQGSVLCPRCAQDSDEDPEEIGPFKPVDFGVNWECPDLYCDDCSKQIPSAYYKD